MAEAPAIEAESSRAEFRPEVGSRVLVVEDDAPLAQLLRQQLQAKSYDVSVVHDGEAARKIIEAGRLDLVILDLNLPKLDGVSLLQQIRPSQPRIPVLVLTARNRVEDRALSLDSGADDCMIKPFSFIELHARVRALLRRNNGPISRVSQVADLTLDREERRVERGGRRIDLTTREYDLLEFLMRNAGRPVSRANLMEQVWNMPFDPTTNLVDVYSTIVFNVGTLAANSQTESDTSKTSLQQLTDQRSALSGVSINEESVNLIRYQQAFEAAAKVISTIDELNRIVLNMGASGGG